MVLWIKCNNYLVCVVCLIKCEDFNSDIYNITTINAKHKDSSTILLFCRSHCALLGTAIMVSISVCCSRVRAECIILGGRDVCLPNGWMRTGYKGRGMSKYLNWAAGKNGALGKVSG